MKKDGFTLVELLAVIVILSLIALVSTPLVLNIIDKAKRKATILSAEEYIDNVEEKMVYKMINGSTLEKREYEVSELENIVSLKGTKPTSGNLSIGEKGEVKKATLCISNFVVEYKNEEAKIVDNDCDKTIDESGGTSSGGSTGSGSTGGSSGGGTSSSKGSGKIYGIKRAIDSESSEWERIEDSEELVAKAQIGAEPVRNDFDNIYPWSEIITVNYDTKENKIVAKYGEDGFKFNGSNGQVMTVIPEFWWKREQKEEDGDTYEYIYITDKATVGYEHSKEFMIGRYTISGSSTAISSKSGVKPLNTAIANFRTYAKNLGEGFGIMDYHYFLIQLLYLVEYADYDSQKILGKGNVSNSSTVASGGCDLLGMKSGSITNDSKHSMIYRGIEDIYGNSWQFVDGVNIKDGQVYVCTKPNEYALNKFDECYNPLSYISGSSSGYISKIGYDSDNPLFAFPTEANGSSSTYIPDYYYKDSKNIVISVGGDFDGIAGPGLWYWGFLNSSNTYGPLGARLLKY